MGVVYDAGMLCVNRNKSGGRVFSTTEGGGKMDKITRVEDISLQPCTNSRYVQPFRVAYKQVSSQNHGAGMIIISCEFIYLSS